MIALKADKKLATLFKVLLNSQPSSAFRIELPESVICSLYRLLYVDHTTEYLF